MAETLDRLPARPALAAIARDLHARGWMAGTAGNLSAHSTGGRFWITASGLPKGRLQEHDFLEVGVQDGRVYQCPRPGTEAVSGNRDSQGCLRFVSRRARLPACAYGRRQPGLGVAPPTQHELQLPALEMIKGLGIWDQEAGRAAEPVRQPR